MINMLFPESLDDKFHICKPQRKIRECSLMANIDDIGIIFSQKPGDMGKGTGDIRDSHTEAHKPT